MGASVGITIALACQRRPPTRSVAFGRPISYRLSDIRLLALSWTLPSLSKTDRAPIVDKIVGLTHLIRRPGNLQKLLSIVEPYLQDMPHCEAYAIWCKALSTASFANAAGMSLGFASAPQGHSMTGWGRGAGPGDRGY